MTVRKLTSRLWRWELVPGKSLGGLRESSEDVGNLIPEHEVSLWAGGVWVGVLYGGLEGRPGGLHGIDRFKKSVRESAKEMTTNFAQQNQRRKINDDSLRQQEITHHWSRGDCANHN